MQRWFLSVQTSLSCSSRIVKGVFRRSGRRLHRVAQLATEGILHSLLMESSRDELGLCVCEFTTKSCA